MPLSLRSNTATRGIPPIPSAPPKNSKLLKIASTMKLMPMVVMARKSSRTRRLGMPKQQPDEGAHGDHAGQGRPERQPGLGGQQRGGVGADPEEGRMAEGDLPREAHDDVEAAGHDAVDGDDGGDGDQVSAQRPPQRDPSSPWDRHMSTPIMAMNASASRGRGMFA